MTAEKQVITSDIDSAPNVVGDDCAGLLVLADSVRVTAASREQLMRGAGLRLKDGEAGVMKVSFENWARKDFGSLKESYGRVSENRPVS